MQEHYPSLMILLMDLQEDNVIQFLICIRDMMQEKYIPEAEN